MSWQDDAACAGIPTRLFYAEGQGGPNNLIVDAAKKVCVDCPVRTECLEAGLYEEFGVWGGMSVEERKLVRRQRNVGRPLPPINCGTAAGYDAHRRRGQEPCDRCRAANTTVARERKRRSRERKAAA